jgi:seryl-tRNA synthetase
MEVLLVTMTTLTVLALIGGAWFAGDIAQHRREIFLTKAEMLSERDRIAEAAQALAKKTQEISLASKEMHDKLETLSTKVMAIQTNMQASMPQFPNIPGRR